MSTSPQTLTQSLTFRPLFDRQTAAAAAAIVVIVVGEKGSAMFRINAPRNDGHVIEGDGGNPQLVAVAVDGDKNSQHALKWAADHIILRGHVFFLLHVRRRISKIPTPIEQDIASAFSKEMDVQTEELLLPFQCFCNRRGLNCREVILDDLNVSKAIVDFVLQYGVDKLVLGASSGNTFLRAFKQSDVPTSVSKIAPEFCSLYVISKGKLSYARPATHAKIHQYSRAFHESEIAGNQFHTSKSDSISRHPGESPRRFALMNGATGYGSKSGRALGQVEGPQELLYSTSSCPSPTRTSIDQKSSHFPEALVYGGRQQPRLSVSSNNENSYLEEQRDSFELYSTTVGSTGYEYSTSMEEAEAKMRRLKLELEMAVDKYEDASKKAYYGKSDEQPGMGGLWSERARTLAMNEKEELELRIQATERKETKFSKTVDRESILLQEMRNKFSSDVKYRKYSIDEIKDVTNNFAESLKIGEGGYGPVFKSTLNYTLVAIKIPRPDVARGMEQFQQEVEVLSSIRHPNLVRLIGACPEYGCLIYEFMANGNLEDCIFCRSGMRPLTWQLRFKIAAEIASALLYLHQTKPEPLVHRDLKPANILLDENFVSKITDVGLARLLPSSTSTSSSQYLATAAAGTFCYIDPECQTTGTVGVKSDVYALGIILLQLISARQAMGLAHSIDSAMEMGTFEEILDPKVPDWPMEETQKLARLALMCAELRRRDRPDLGAVVVPELNRLRELADLSIELGRRN